jgi:hypothetical protein
LAKTAVGLCPVVEEWDLDLIPGLPLPHPFHSSKAKSGVQRARAGEGRVYTAEWRVSKSTLGSSDPFRYLRSLSHTEDSLGLPAIPRLVELFFSTTSDLSEILLVTPQSRDLLLTSVKEPPRSCGLFDWVTQEGVFRQRIDRSRQSGTA